MSRLNCGRNHGAHRFTPWIAVAVFAARICGHALVGFLLAIASSRSPERRATRPVPMPPALAITPPERANLE